MFEAVGNVLKASLSHGSDEPAEANSSQVGALDQMQASSGLHTHLMPVSLGFLTPIYRRGNRGRGYSASWRQEGRL